MPFSKKQEKEGQMNYQKQFENNEVRFGNHFVCNGMQIVCRSDLIPISFWMLTLPWTFWKASSPISGTCEGFFWREFQEMLVVSYLVFQACVAKALAIYRIENLRNLENRRKIWNYRKILFFQFLVYFSPIFAYFSPIFWISGVFLFCRWPRLLQGVCLTWQRFGQEWRISVLALFA